MYHLFSLSTFKQILTVVDLVLFFTRKRLQLTVSAIEHWGVLPEWYFLHTVYATVILQDFGCLDIITYDFMRFQLPYSFLDCFLCNCFLYANLLDLGCCSGRQVKIPTELFQTDVLKFIIFSTFNMSYVFIPQRNRNCPWYLPGIS